MQLLFDNIIFELQVRGGISHLWAKLADYCLRDPDISLKCIEGPTASGNMFRSLLDLSRSEAVSDRRLPLMLRRYLPVRRDFGQIFHSSYFRRSRNSRHKQVVTVHDLIYEKFGVSIGQGIHMRQKASALRVADAVICVSENTKQDLLEHYTFVPEDTVSVIPNGVGEEFHPLAEAPGELSIDGTRIEAGKFMLFVGKRVQYKNFDVALDLIASKEASDRGLALVVVSGAFSRGELANIERRGLRNRIVSVPAPTAAELNRLYNLAYGLVFPSLYEGFGIPLLEAMSAGCPVLAADTSSIPEVVGDAALLCDPRQSEDFVDKLQKLGDDDQRRRLVSAGLRRARMFSWNRTCRMTVELYKSLS